MIYYRGFPVVRCTGYGQGICFRCKSLGRQPINWMTMLYRCSAFDGLICSQCLDDLLRDDGVISN